MNLRKFAAPSLALLLLGGSAAGIWRSHLQLESNNTASAAAETQLTSVRGLIGSEKQAFFADPRVRDALAARGLHVDVQKAGSREIAREYDAKRFDFGFPSGSPSAAHLRSLANTKHSYTPFYTPIVIASFRPIAEILQANGVVQREGDVYYIIDLQRLLELEKRGVRWNQLSGNTSFNTSKSVLVNSTDVRTSNSAAMYLALVSYLANGQQVVQSQPEVEAVMDTVAPLFLRQGFLEESSSGPFEDYLALGMGKSPLVLAYESQLIELWLQHPDKLKSDFVVLYPRPTLYSKHVLIPYTPAGEKLGAALEQDPTLHQLAHEHGFRTGGDDKGPDFWKTRGIEAPSAFVDVIDPPSYEWLERMIEAVAARYR